MQSCWVLLPSRFSSFGERRQFQCVQIIECSYQAVVVATTATTPSVSPPLPHTHPKPCLNL